MSIPTKWKGPQTPSSHCSMGITSKWQVTGSRSRSGASGASGSRQWGDTPSPDVTKFKPNSEAESHFNRSFKSHPVFVFQGVMLNDFLKTLIYTYSNKWSSDHLAISDGIVCRELVQEFFANIHSMDKEAGTLKSYVRGVFLDFSISDICNFHHIQPLDPDIIGFLILHLGVGLPWILWLVCYWPMRVIGHLAHLVFWNKKGKRTCFDYSTMLSMICFYARLTWMRLTRLVHDSCMP